MYVAGWTRVRATGVELAWAGKVATLSPFMHVRE
jgi:hypothetical protein